MLYVTPSISLADEELEMSFIRASGPGGQNVNKVSSAVQLRFDVYRSMSLPQAVRERLIALAGARLTREGILIIVARRFRTQQRNRQDAIERLVELIRQATYVKPKRTPTKPSKGAQRRRVQNKRHRSEVKKMRGRIRGE